MISPSRTRAFIVRALLPVRLRSCENGEPGARVQCAGAWRLALGGGIAVARRLNFTISLADGPPARGRVHAEKNRHRACVRRCGGLAVEHLVARAEAARRAAPHRPSRCAPDL